MAEDTQNKAQQQQAENQTPTDDDATVDNTAAAEEQPVEPIDPQAEEIANLKQQIADLNDRYLRLSAEYDNFRKRTIKEKAEIKNVVTSDTVLGLLPVIDDFERAISHMSDAADVDALREGVELIFKKFNEYLTKAGVTAIPAAGEPFDTDLHEAITKMPAPSPDMKGKVFDCVEKGYRLGDKVIRFAKVVVCE